MSPCLMRCDIFKVSDSELNEEQRGTQGWSLQCPQRGCWRNSGHPCDEVPAVLTKDDGALHLLRRKMPGQKVAKASLQNSMNNLIPCMKNYIYPI